MADTNGSKLDFVTGECGQENKAAKGMIPVEIRSRHIRGRKILRKYFCNVVAIIYFSRESPTINFEAILQQDS